MIVKTWNLIHLVVFFIGNYNLFLKSWRVNELGFELDLLCVNEFSLSGDGLHIFSYLKYVSSSCSSRDL